MMQRFYLPKLLIALILYNCSAPGQSLSSFKQCWFNPEAEIYSCSVIDTGYIFYAGQMQYIDNIYYKDGMGIEYFNNGDIYQGSWKMGERHGIGSYIVLDKTACLSNWLNDRQSGIVKCTYTGDHDGHIRQGLTDGAGNWAQETTYIFPDGKIVEEYWENGKLTQQKGT